MFKIKLENYKPGLILATLSAKSKVMKSLNSRSKLSVKMDAGLSL